MEVDITGFFRTENPNDFSGSIATHGADARKATWNAALGLAAERPPLETAEQLDAMRQWAKESGGWEDEEIAAWSDVEVNALFIQLVSVEIQEGGLAGVELDDTEAWDRYERDAGAGRVSGSIFRSGELVYYFLGS